MYPFCSVSIASFGELKRILLRLQVAPVVDYKAKKFHLYHGSVHQSILGCDFMAIPEMYRSGLYRTNPRLCFVCPLFFIIAHPPTHGDPPTLSLTFALSTQWSFTCWCGVSSMRMSFRKFYLFLERCGIPLTQRTRKGFLYLMKRVKRSSLLSTI